VSKRRDELCNGNIKLQKGREIEAKYGKKEGENKLQGTDRRKIQTRNWI
jgi:hypothetical protein